MIATVFLNSNKAKTKPLKQNKFKLIKNIRNKVCSQNRNYHVNLPIWIR